MRCQRRIGRREIGDIGIEGQYIVGLAIKIGRAVSSLHRAPPQWQALITDHRLRERAGLSMTTA
jgi:hypothetical protein